MAQRDASPTAPKYIIDLFNYCGIATDDSLPYLAQCHEYGFEENTEDPLFLLFRNQNVCFNQIRNLSLQPATLLSRS